MKLNPIPPRPSSWICENIWCSVSDFSSVSYTPTPSGSLPILILLTHMCVQVPRFLYLYLKEVTTSSVESMYIMISLTVDFSFTINKNY